MREVKRIIRGLAGLNFVYVTAIVVLSDHILTILCRGADIVEVAPAYDHGKQIGYFILVASIEYFYSRDHRNCCRGYCS